VALPFKQLEVVDEVEADPLLFVLLEMILRMSPDTGTQLQAMHLLAVTCSHSKSELYVEADPSWATLLPLTSALITASKVLRTSDWDGESLVLATKLLQDSFQSSFCVFSAWVVRKERVPLESLNPAVRELQGTDKDPELPESPASAKMSASRGGRAGTRVAVGRGSSSMHSKEQHQQQERCEDSSEGSHMEEIAQYLENGHILDTFKWALMAAGSSLAEVVGDVAWVALQASRQAYFWGRVAQHMAAVGGHDKEVFARYCQGVRHLQSLSHCNQRTTVKRLAKMVTGCVQLVYNLFQEFGRQRMLGWARGVSSWFPNDVKESLSLMLDFEALVTLVTTTWDDKGNMLLDIDCCALLHAIRGWTSAAADPFCAAGSFLPQNVLKELTAKVPAELTTARQERLRPELYTKKYNKEEDDMYRSEERVTMGFMSCTARGCCNNPYCRNLGGVGELALVIWEKGARGVCGGCNEACYCSRACQEEAWPLHQRYCLKYREMVETVCGSMH
jgi:hypothetical protein